MRVETVAAVGRAAGVSVSNVTRFVSYLNEITYSPALILDFVKGYIVEIRNYES